MKDKINEIREMFNNHGKVYAKAEDVIIEQETVATIDCYWFNKAGQDAKQLIIYLHGGAFTLGGMASHAALVSHFAREFKLPVLFVEYSLAPEKPFPAAINEVLKVYQAIFQQYTSTEIIFLGDSAGAGLAISVISALNNMKIKIPKLLLMISPWVDLECNYESHVSNAAFDTIFGGKRELLLGMAAMYAGDEKVQDVSPVKLMTGHFPPTLIIVGSTEVLLDDSREVYARILSGQPDVKLSVYKNEKHVWPFEDIHTQQSKMAMRELKEFITKK